MVPYEIGGDTFAAGKPRRSSEQPIANVGFARSFDLAADGTRFVALMPASLDTKTVQNQVTFLLNFGDELARRTRLTSP